MTIDFVFLIMFLSLRKGKVGANRAGRPMIHDPKQTKSQTSLEAIHSTTRRSTTTGNKTDELPSLSSSSKA